MEKSGRVERRKEAERERERRMEMISEEWDVVIGGDSAG
jgi:hypothetical protein